MTKKDLIFVFMLGLFVVVSCKMQQQIPIIALDCAAFDSTYWHKEFQDKRAYHALLKSEESFRSKLIQYTVYDSLVILPTEIICFNKTLKTLSIVNNPKINIEQSFKVISNLSNLVELQIVNCNIKKVPTSIGFLKNLKTLMLNSNSDIIFPNEIINLKKLENLDLSFVSKLNLEDLFLKIKNLPIKRLYLSNCNIKNIPQTIGKMQYLEEIILSGNPIEKLPCEINNLKNCRFVLPKEMPKSMIPSCLKNYPFEFQ